MRSNMTRAALAALGITGISLGLLAGPAAAQDPPGSDVVTWDVDGNGKIDAVTVDFDVDGQPEEVEWDFDEDGICDQLTIYKDGKVVKTYTAEKGGEYYDTCYVHETDGSVTVHTDLNGDGTFDQSKPFTGGPVAIHPG